MAFYAVRQAAAIHTSHLRGSGRDARREIGREATLVSGTVGVSAAVLLCVTAPYLLLTACFIALGGVFEGSGGAPALLRVTVLGTAVQLPLAYGLSGLGLPGVCLAPALATAVQCAVVAVLFRRARTCPADQAVGKPRRGSDAGGRGPVRAVAWRRRV